MPSTAFSNILAVIDMVLTISPTSAEVERGFTQLKLIKNDRRNRLSGEHLSTLMTIKLLSKPVEDYDPMPAIELWNLSGQRRPTFRVPDSSAFDTRAEVIVQESETAAEPTEHQGELEEPMEHPAVQA